MSSAAAAAATAAETRPCRRRQPFCQTFHVAAIAAVFCVLFVALRFASPVDAQTANPDWSWAPPMDKIAPPNPAWTRAFLGPSSSTKGDGGSSSSGHNALDRIVDGLVHERRGRNSISRRDASGSSSSLTGNDVSTDAGPYVEYKYCAASLGDDAWGLAYDDGPSDYSESLQNALSAANVKATFFAIGSRVRDRPDLLLRAFTSGHQIALHTWSHPHLSQLSTDQVVAEVVYGAMAVKAVTGVVPKYIRPPYGDLSDPVRAVLKAMGLRVVLWAVDSTDSNANVTVGSIDATVAGWISNGVRRAISLEHDLFQYQAAAAADSLKTLLAAGRKPVPVSQCIARDDADRYADSPLAQLIGGHLPTTPPALTPTSSSSSSTSSQQSATKQAGAGGGAGRQDSTSSVPSPAPSSSPATSPAPATSSSAGAPRRAVAVVVSVAVSLLAFALAAF